MTGKDNSPRMTAVEVLLRYKEEQLPAFVEIPLENVNQVGNFGDRPLHVAAGRGNIEEITALIDAGADINAQGDLQNTPLHEAIGQGHIEAAKLLLANGASPNAKNEFGQTPIDIARLKRRDDLLALFEK